MHESTGPNAAESPDDLVLANVPLVGFLVGEMLGRVPSHVRGDELMSAGLAALVQAARSFDPARGAAFSHFASVRIKGAIVDELRSADWASRSVRTLARKREAAEESLTARLGRRPTTQELAARLGASDPEVMAGEHDVRRAVVLSLHTAGSLSEAVEDQALSPDERLLHRERLGYLRDAVVNLPGRLRTVVERYFFEERLMADIAAELGVTESRVSQLRAEAIALLRDALNAQLAPELVRPPGRPGRPAARRREAYFAAVAEHSDFRARLSTPLADEVAEEIAWVG